ncbi:hypothetical protein NB640_01765 [Oxalobacter vibrioformis]|uniref:SbsA Ig-like domain-containing protein n=1 Tax=Oxalobacter vibrioformis TaxID=933080 RepID=A0A9E9LWA5_9BURK|nr:hypothetical protein [Oxalobacter vibrioformis]WAW10416.1 hypothetical protein NB640_01765 [Oxalobacter vibrioformis]
MRKLLLLPVLFLYAFSAHSLANAAPSLTVTDMQPAGEAAYLTQIVVRFSENMRSSGQTEQDATTSPLQLKTSSGDLPAGKYRWTDPATLTYLFDEPVAAPLTIMATVLAGAKALSGRVLNKTVSWKVSTPPYDFSVAPYASLPAKNPIVALSSNYEITPGILKDKLSILMNGQMIPFAVDETQHPIPPGHRSIYTAFGYRIDMQADLPPNAIVEIRLAPGITFKKGGEPAKAHTFIVTGYKSQ